MPHFSWFCWASSSGLTRRRFPSVASYSKLLEVLAHWLLSLRQFASKYCQYIANIAIFLSSNFQYMSAILINISAILINILESDTARARRAAQWVPNSEFYYRVEVWQTWPKDETQNHRKPGTQKHIQIRNMLSKERIMDCIMHSRLRDETICLEAKHDLKTR